MFHNDDTLNLLEKYRKNKYNEKESGKFWTKNVESSISKIVWIPIVILVGYFIVNNVKQKEEKQNEVKKEIVNIPQKPTQFTQPSIERKIEITPSKPIVVQQTQPIIKTEPQKQTTTIEVVPQQSQPKQETMKKIEVEEEIRPGSSTSVGYYR